MENLHGNMHAVIFKIYMRKHKNMHVFMYFLHLMPPLPPPPHYIVTVKGLLACDTVYVWYVSANTVTNSFTTAHPPRRAYRDHLDESVSAEHEPGLQRLPLSQLLLLGRVQEALAAV